MKSTLSTCVVHRSAQYERLEKSIKWTEHDPSLISSMNLSFNESERKVQQDGQIKCD